MKFRGEEMYNVRYHSSDHTKGRLDLRGKQQAWKERKIYKKIQSKNLKEIDCFEARIIY